MKNRHKEDEDIAKLFNDPDKLTIIIQSGIRDALLKHKQAGNPICEWKTDKVVWISPENIPDINSSKT